jgi:hypothetical protein
MVENSPKVSRMVNPLFGVGGEIVKISLHNLSDVMESVRHSPLEGGTSIFEAESHFPIGKSAPRANEGCLVLIFRFDLDLVVPRESIHKGEYFISKIVIQYLFNEGCGIIVFRTCLVQIPKISTKSNFAILLVDCNRVRNPLCQRDRVYKAIFQ